MFRSVIVLYTLLVSYAGSERPVALMPSADCSEERVALKLNPVCPHSGDTAEEPFTFFEQAQHPILSVELRAVPKNSMSAHVRMSRDHFLAASLGPLPGLRPDKGSTVVHHIDLRKEDLFTRSFEKEVVLRYGEPDAKSKRVLAIFVCNDTNEDGKCSDEKDSQQISLRPPVHQACSMPKQIPVAVWAGCP